ncbi:MAG: N-acetyltransferase [Gemmatimonadetes bacterium]|nr:N-acetyltransferase [Gemmatimonadota bacterium]
MEIVPVSDGRGLNRFIAFPYEHYRGDPLWVPPLRMDVRTLLSPKKNPFFEHAEAQHFVAEADGPKGLSSGRRIVGRIAAIQNDAHNREHTDKVGFYGFFECVNDQAVANALFDTAARWLKAKGFDTMRGPMSPSINDECGLLVDGFDTPPTLMMPHNPCYYVALHEAYGFAKAKDLLVYEGGGEVPERIARTATLLAKRKQITLRPLDMKRFDAEVALIKQIYNQAWERNWGFVPLSDAEIDHLAKQLKPVAVPDLVCFAYKDGRPIGFGAALPDLNVALRHNPSGRLFPGILKVLWHARRIHRARILLLGVVPEYRGTGVDALMYHWIWTHGVARGFRWGEAGWILEDNVAMNNAALRLGFRVYKTYRVYDKQL